MEQIVENASVQNLAVVVLSGKEEVLDGLRPKLVGNLVWVKEWVGELEVEPELENGLVPNLIAELDAEATL